MNIKTFSVCSLVAAAAFVLGLSVKDTRLSVVNPDTAVSSEPEPLYWVAPMDDNYRRDKPGKSPMGMDLVPVYPQEISAEGGVLISAAVENNLGVRTEMVSIEPIQLPIEAVGFVQFDEDRLHHIHVRAEGWIERLYISTEGDVVKKGQKLFDFFSPELVNAQEDYLSLLSSLGDDRNRSLVRAAKTRLQALGISQQQIERLLRTRQVEQYVAYYAHADGFVSGLHVRHGMFVEPASEIMGVGNTDSVWVIAEVFERQIARLAVGQAVTIRINARPGEQWLGRIDYLYPELDDKTRTAKVRVVIENADARLKPNMFAALTIAAPVAENVPHIARQALIRGGRGDRVVISKGDGQFQSRAVLAGAELGGRVQIIEGLSAGERVVLSGQFLIDSESNLDSELLRLRQSNSGSIDSIAAPQDPSNNPSTAASSSAPVEMDHSMHEGMNHE